MKNEIKTIKYPNGVIKTIIPYVEGKKNGRSISYYINGIIKSTTDYCDDKIDGYVRTYYEDGSLESQESYRNGIRNNDLVVFNRNRFNEYDYHTAYETDSLHRHM